jgi:hypothetical protein
METMTTQYSGTGTTRMLPQCRVHAAIKPRTTGVVRLLVDGLGAFVPFAPSGPRTSD